MRELLTTLKMIQMLSENQMSSTDLQTELKISRATVNRKIAEARNLGTKIESVQNNRMHMYSVTNWKEIKKTVQTWINLEEKRSLL